MFYHLTLVSGNKKTGPIPVSMTAKNSCPDACPLKNGNGCFSFGYPLNMHWDKVSSGQRGISLEQFTDRVSKLWKNQVWRHNQAGDLPGENNDIDRASLDAIVQANKKAGAKGFTYTHKPVGWNTLQEINNSIAVTDATLNGFTINLSANSLHHADKLAKLGIAPVAALVELDAPRHGKTPEGRHYSVCPAQERDDVTCDNCKLCQLPKRKVIIGFRPHGISKKKVLNVIQQNSCAL